MLLALDGLDTQQAPPPIPQTGFNLQVSVDTALQIAILGPRNEVTCSARTSLTQAGHRVQIFETAEELLDTDFCQSLDLTMLMGISMEALVDICLAYGTPSLQAPFWTCFEENRFHQMLLLNSIWDSLFIDKRDRRHYGKDLKWGAIANQVKLAAWAGPYVETEPETEIWH